MKPSKIIAILASAGLMVSAIAPKATSLTLDFSRTVSNPSNDIFVTSGINIANANNIYVVDGINNSLEVLDPSVWVPPSTDVPSKQPSIYYLNGINNTLQVLDNTQAGASGKTPDKLGNVFLLDEFNKKLAIADPNTTGLMSSSGSRNGQLNIPKNAIQNPSDNYYLVDGFNNSLEITNRSGVNQASQAPPAAQTFFTGSSGIEPPQLEALMSSGGTSAENSFSSIASGSFGGVAQEQQIIDSIGNPNRELGWRKNLSVEEKTLSLQRSVSSGDWEIDSPISASKASGVHLVDGFNNALQVIKSEDSESVYLVDGTNNSLQVSDTSDQFSMFGSNNSSKSFQARSGANPSGGSLNPDFLSLLADYADGDVPSNLPDIASEKGIKPNVALDMENSDNGLFGSTTTITANQNEDFYEAQKINNRIELVDQTGQVFSIADRQAAVDGSGNIYLAKGINNRIRVASDTQTAAEVASVPEPSSVFGLALLGFGVVRWKKRIRKQGEQGRQGKL